MFKLKEDSVSQSHQFPSNVRVSLQKRIMVDIMDRGSRQTLFSPKMQKEFSMVQIG